MDQNTLVVVDIGEPDTFDGLLREGDLTRKHTKEDISIFQDISWISFLNDTIVSTKHVTSINIDTIT